jgi:hypothetical protein
MLFSGGKSSVNGEIGRCGWAIRVAFSVEWAYFLGMKTMRWAVALMALALLGCATTRVKYEPLTKADIISLTKAGVTDDEIIVRIDQTRTVFVLTADDVVTLREEGVSARVIDYMLETRVRAAAEEERRRARYDYPPPYWYGPHIGLGYYYYRR